MILAAIDGQIVLVALMALFGFINWISSKLNAGKPPSAKSTPPPASEPAPEAARTSEEERMRQFFEALGLPADSAPVPPRPRSAPPVLPVLPSAAPVLPRLQPRVAPLPAPPPLPAARAAWAEEESPTPERFIIPELTTPVVREYETVAARISAAPTSSGPAEEPAVRSSELDAALHRALFTAQGLRSAFVLREILGPPPGLQS